MGQSLQTFPDSAPSNVRLAPISDHNIAEVRLAAMGQERTLG